MRLIFKHPTTGREIDRAVEIETSDGHRARLKFTGTPLPYPAKWRAERIPKGTTATLRDGPAACVATITSGSGAHVHVRLGSITTEVTPDG